MATPAIVEVACGGVLHRLRVDEQSLTPLDHDLEDERALAALGGTGAECLVLATLAAWVDRPTLLRMGWDSSPVLARHLPAHELVAISASDWAGQRLGGLPDGMSADDLRRRLAVVAPPSADRDQEVVELTEEWWSDRARWSRQILGEVVGPRFTWVVERSLASAGVAFEDYNVDVGLTEGRDTVVVGRLAKGKLDLQAYVAYPWVADVWAAGIDAEPGRLIVGGDGRGIEWSAVRWRRRSRRLPLS